MMPTNTNAAPSSARIARLTLRWAVVALLFASSLGTAQPRDEAANWYQVEVIIFERLSGAGTGDPELWPKNINLSYPREWQKLLSAEKAAEIEASVLAQAEQPSADVAAPETGAETSSFQLQADTNLVADTGSPLEDEPLPPVLRVDDHLELGFVRLPPAERTLNESKGAIDRNRNMRVLFHEGWRQPIHSAKEAPAIIVQGGNTYGDHTELEGSVRVSISRYLHLHSNLWLTEFIPNYGQEPEHWPPLPPAPSHEQAVPRVEDEPAYSLSGDEGDESLWHIDTDTIDEYSSLIQKPFLAKQIITLQQNRRMRSGELHYLDHPRLGLLIKVDTYTPETDEPN